MARATLEELVIADAPGVWEALGFAVAADATVVGGVVVRLVGTGEGGKGHGIVGWRVAGVGRGALDGLPDPAPSPAPAPPPIAREHPNGIVAIDHVVVLTDDFDRSSSALTSAGLERRRVREVPGGSVRQGFFPIGPALLELAGPVDGPKGARLWGVTLVASDIDALAARLGDRLGPVRDAVQPGRRIATLRREAGSGTAIAFMSPRRTA